MFVTFDRITLARLPCRAHAAIALCKRISDLKIQKLDLTISWKEIKSSIDRAFRFFSSQASLMAEHSNLSLI